MATLEDQVKEKYSQLARVNQELDELNARKLGLVKELNVQLLDADAKAKGVIASAQDQAKAIMSEAGEVKKDADRYSANKKFETDELLRNSQNVAKQISQSRTTLDNDKVDFDAKKFAFENDIKRLKNEANSVMAQASETDRINAEKTIHLNTREANIMRRETEVATATAKLSHDKEEVKRKNEDLVKREGALTKESNEVKAISEANDKLLADIDEKRKQIDLDIEASKKLNEETLAQKKQNDTDKEMINAQFDRIEKDNSALEERKIALDEEKQLLAIKERDISKKLATLTELRKKTE
jgi:uncharacterized protein YuzE